MYRTEDIVEEYGIAREELNHFLKKSPIPMVNKEKFVPNYFNSVLDLLKTKENKIKQLLKKSAIPMVNEEEIAAKYFQSVLAFIENQENRIQNKLRGEVADFNYNKNRVTIYQDDAISFLKKLPSNSVDIIATDPAY